LEENDMEVTVEKKVTIVLDQREHRILQNILVAVRDRDQSPPGFDGEEINFATELRENLRDD
jgi:hypothetical protein